MFNNPLIQRYRYSTLRPKQFRIYVTIYISIILLIVFINYSSYKIQAFDRDITQFHRSLYCQLLIFQILIFLFWGAYNSGSAIRDEILNKSFDFFRMLPLPAHKKALGILIGKNLVVLLFGAINLAMLICFGLWGQISINLQGQVILILISLTILLNLVFLLSSINPAKKGKSSGVILILLVIFLLGPMTISTIIQLSSVRELENYPAYFFQMKIPILLLISFIALYFSCWIFKGILRRFTREQESLFTRKGAMLFLLGYIFIVIGMYYNYVPEMKKELIYSYWLVTLSPVLFIPWGSLRNLDEYIEYSRFIQRQPGSPKTSVFAILKRSNLSLIIFLFAIWAVSSIGITLFADSAGMNLLSNLYDVLCLFSCYLFFVLLLELYVVYVPVSSKIGLLLGFIAILYVILPLILSGIFQSETIYLYSPGGFIVSLFVGYDISITIKTTFWLMNALFCAFPVSLILKRYNYVLTQRQKM